MVAYVAQRLLAIAFILFVMSLLIFGITQVMPGNVAYMIAGPVRHAGRGGRHRGQARPA